MPSFEEKLSWGEEGEQTIASLLIRRGVAVAPLYQFHNHDSTPILLTEKENLILPDLTCWSDGLNYFVECKRKNQWVKFNGNVETGLNQKHFRHYERLKAITGQDVYLFFLHEKEMPGVYFGELHALKPHMREWDGLVRGSRFSPPLALFPKHVLKELEEYRGAA